MNDLADDDFREIQLSGKQLVFLFIVTTTVLVGIFLLGVQVGRTVKSDRIIEGGELAASATPPAAATPSQPAAAGGPPAAEPPAPAPEPDDELSYAKRLQGDQSASPAETLKSPAPAAQATVPPSALAPRPPPAASAGQAQAPVARQAPPTEPAAGGASRPGAWIVQLTALQDRNAATAIAQRLISKGYPAFVLDPAPGSPTIYRVQVGGFPDRDKADEAAHRLEKEEQFKTYVRSR